MPRKKSTTEAKEYYIKGKQEIKDDAPVISNEFVDNETGYTGQTIEVQSETKLESDLGTGKPYILRTYEFATSPEFLNKMPSPQEIFNSHMRGIAGMMWADGMTPVTDLEPRFIFTRDRKRYLIMVWAQPSLGQTILETPQTLSQIANESRRHKDTV